MLVHLYELSWVSVHVGCLLRKLYSAKNRTTPNIIALDQQLNVSKRDSTTMQRYTVSVLNSEWKNLFDFLNKDSRAGNIPQ